MFIVLDGEAEFTIDGRTSRIAGPAGAPNVLGSSHAIYNPTDRPVAGSAMSGTSSVTS